MALSLTVGPVAWEASAETGTFGETIIPATLRVTPGYGSVASVGPSGFLHYATTTGGPSSLQWTGVDGSTRKLEGTHPMNPLEYHGAASDVVALRPAGSRDVVLRNMVTDETATVTVAAGQTYDRTVGTTVVTKGGATAEGQWTEFHLLNSDNGTTIDRRVTGLPEDSSIIAVGRAGLQGFLAVLKRPGQDAGLTVWVNLDTAQATLLPGGTSFTNTVVTARHLVLPQPGGVQIYEQARLDTPVREVQINLTDAKVVGVVGDSLIVARYDPSLGSRTHGASIWRIVAAPFDGSGERTLLARAVADRVAVRPDGGVQLVGGQSAEDYGYQAVTAAADGVPRATRVLRIAPVPMQIRQLTLDHGTVRSLESGDGATLPYARPLTTAVPGYGARVRAGSLPELYDTCNPYELSCPELFPTGDGRTVYRAAVIGDSGLEPELFVVGNGEVFPGTPRETGLQDSFDDVRPQMRILGASGNLVLVAGTPAGGSEELRVIDIDTGKVLHTEPYRTSALWGTTLFTSAPGGTVTAKDARTGAPLTSFAAGTGCTNMFELQGVGRWLYWKCNTSTADTAGVYDLHTKKNIRLASAGQAFLGDGLVAVRSGQALAVYGLGTGTAVRQWWTDAAGLVAIDPRDGGLAYTTAGQAVHVLHTGRPAAALISPYKSVTTRTETDSTPLSWRGEWWLSEPAASWKVELRHKGTGRLVATRSGGAAQYSIAAKWDGRDARGGLLPNGSYTWTLTAQPADGQGAPLVQSGTVRLTGGTAVWRDHIGASSLPDGIGDLLTVNSAGTLTFHRGDGAGKFSGTVSSTGWPASARAIPIGDLNNDRCADVLVRPGDGSLRLYKPACGTVAKATTPYTALGTGWNQYDVLTSPADVTGDGLPDLIARNASTGTVYLYKGTRTGKLAARVKLADNWTIYKKIVGAGDLNGDGIGDLLVQDKYNNHYRYTGRGNGTFTARVKLAAGWGSTYDTVVGVGDITGDGKADLVARDTSGNLHRHAGAGTGTFNRAVRIGTGWQTYKALS
ncbi:FG-GAP-like repeat-containing protein [Streptomyces sp. enrichment culture]|uniref:FG-GAP-like repeat-containing protein n=1 Tax=Streptomyces sp. enrichment culture TaxID=1795815 RepID=UPI003F561F17